MDIIEAARAAGAWLGAMAKGASGHLVMDACDAFARSFADAAGREQGPGDHSELPIDILTYDEDAKIEFPGSEARLFADVRREYMMLVLDRPSGPPRTAPPDTAPYAHIERRPDRWRFYFHDDAEDPVLLVDVMDSGTIAIEDLT